MGVDWTAHAVIGCRIPVEKLFRKTRIRGCGHKLLVPGQEVGYCPVCGVKVWRTCMEELFDPDTDSVGGVPLFWGTERRVAVAGFVWAKDWERWREDDLAGFAEVPDTISGVRHKTREALKPLGLWDGDLFGLWAILHASV